MVSCRELFSSLLTHWKKVWLPISFVILVANIGSIIGVMIDKSSNWNILLGLGNFFLLFLSAGIITKIAIQSYLGKSLIWSELLKGSLRRWFSLLGTFILIGLVVFVFLGIGVGLFFMGSLLAKGLESTGSLIVIISLMVYILAAIVFNFYILMGFSLSITAMFAENLGCVDCMDRSWKLTKGHRFKILMLYFSILVPFFVLAAGEILLYHFAFDVLLPIGILSVIGASLGPVLSTIIFFDLKKREELLVPVETSVEKLL